MENQPNSPLIFDIQMFDSLFQKELIEPAVKGTLNVLGSCSKISSVKRVVVTSSTAAVEVNRRPKPPETLVDETWFSDPDLCKEMKVSIYMNPKSPFSQWHINYI